MHCIAAMPIADAATKSVENSEQYPMRIACSTGNTAPIAEIRADDDGLTELRGQLERIRKEKALVEARLRKNRSVAARHDVEIGPFDKMWVDRDRLSWDQCDRVLLNPATSWH